MCGSIGHCNSIDCITNMFHLMIGLSEYLVATSNLFSFWSDTHDFSFVPFPSFCMYTFVFVSATDYLSRMQSPTKTNDKQIYNTFFEAQYLRFWPNIIRWRSKWSNQCHILNVLSGDTWVYVFWLCSVAKTEKMLFCLQEKCCSLTEGSFAVIASNSAINPLTWQKISPIIFFIVFII